MENGVNEGGEVFAADKRKQDVAVDGLVRSRIVREKFCFAMENYLEQIFYN